MIGLDTTLKNCSSIKALRREVAESSRNDVKMEIQNLSKELVETTKRKLQHRFDVFWKQ